MVPLDAVRGSLASSQTSPNHEFSFPLDLSRYVEVLQTAVNTSTQVVVPVMAPPEPWPLYYFIFASNLPHISRPYGEATMSNGAVWDGRKSLRIVQNGWYTCLSDFPEHIEGPQMAANGQLSVLLLTDK